MLGKITMMMITVIKPLHLYRLADGFCCLFVLFQAMLDEDEDDRVDETALQQLTEMGFPESRAIKALRLNQ